MTKMNDRFFKYTGHRGKRYFRIVSTELLANSAVVQVCISPGKAKTGRANCRGIYVISKITLMSNYGLCADLKECGREEYAQAFEKVLKMLQP